MRLTCMYTFQGVEEADQQVHEHSQVEGDAAPEGHVPGAPVQDGLSWVLKFTQVIVQESFCQLMGHTMTSKNNRRNNQRPVEHMKQIIYI